jgi:transposase-like protein
MTALSLEAKEAIVKQALGANTKRVIEIAKYNNVSCSAVYGWLKSKREGRPLGRRIQKGLKQEVSHEDRLNHLLSTAHLDENSLGVYCRTQGIYSHQLTEWRKEFMENSHDTKNENQSKELRSLKAEVKLLKKDLHKKDKALAEVSALLILKKKADLIWGDHGDD